MSRFVKALRTAGRGAALSHLLQPLSRLLMSLTLGMAGGAWLGFALQARGTTALRGRITPAVATRRAFLGSTAFLMTRRPGESACNKSSSMLPAPQDTES